MIRNKLFTVLLLVLVWALSAVNGFARIPPLERVEPAFWWAGMRHSQLQLLVHGQDIASCTVSLSYPGVMLQEVHKVENANYLFLDLQLAQDVHPGKFTIRFEQKGAKPLTYEYELKQRDPLAKKAQGVTAEDIIYLLIPDRFANGDYANDKVKGMRDQTLQRDSMYYRHGGDIQGIIDHLDYLKDLGITAIWSTPEVENDMTSASYHGYAVTDHYKIDPRYGTNELYRAYVQLCHNKGLKVIKDIVHNHVGTEHWFVQDLPMKDWLHQWPQFTQTNYRETAIMDPYGSADDKKQVVDGWFVSSMPDLNEQNVYVQRYLTQNNIWWIEYAGIDGLRLDTYYYNDAAFMAQWAQYIKEEYPALSIFGETLVYQVLNQAYFTEGNTVNRGMDTHLPGVTDFCIKDAIQHSLNDEPSWSGGVNALYNTLATDFVYKNPYNNVVFLDNHDQDRFASVISEDTTKYKSGIAMVLTMRGVPQIYYGTELMMKNFSRPDGLVRQDFKGGWKEDKTNKFTDAGRSATENSIYNYLRTLANYRQHTPALQNGKMMQYIPQDGLYVYFRYDHQATVMVVYNSNNKPSHLGNMQRFHERTDGFASRKEVMAGGVEALTADIEVPAKTVMIYELKK